MPQEIEVIAQPEGFDDFKKRMMEELAQARQIGMRLDVQGLEIGRLIAEYSERNEIKSEVDRINKARQDAKLGGRPKAYHCYVAELLVAECSSIRKDWLESCYRGFRNAQLKGLPMDTPVHEALKKKGANILLDASSEDATKFLTAPDRIFPDESAPAATPPEQLKPKFGDLVRGFSNTLDGLYKRAGEPSLRAKQNQEKLADALATWFEQRGCTVEITFK